MGRQDERRALAAPTRAAAAPANADKAFEEARRLAAESGAHRFVLNVVSGGEVIAASASPTWLPFADKVVKNSPVPVLVVPE